MQNIEHIRDVSSLAAKYITPGGPDDFEPDNNNNNDQDDDKKSALDANPPSLERQVTAYFFSKYTPTQLKELVEAVFSEHFDTEKNGDIDINEFENALENLGMNMNKTRMDKLFTLISSNDGDETDQYVDKVNFSDFILQKYYNQPQLQQYQEELLRAISPKFQDKKTVKLDTISSFNTDESEEIAMKRHLGLMVERELKQIEADSLFQEELIKRKTNNNNNNKFCDEMNAENWDKYEVAYWVGNILGFTYCMKRFFDEKINGSMLLDIDKMLLQRLGLKQIHLNHFQRRLQSLRKIALKDMYDAQREKEQKEREEKEKQNLLNKPYGNRGSLILDINTMNNIHIGSEMKYKMEEYKTRIQEIELNATKNENKLNKEITGLNKEITSLTKDKLDYEKEINLLKQEMEQNKREYKQEMDLFKKKNQNLQRRNEELELQRSQELKLNDDIKQDQDKPDNCYKFEIEKLKSQLRQKEMETDLLKSQINREKSLETEMIDNYGGDQILDEQQHQHQQQQQQQHSIKQIMEPPSPIHKQQQTQKQQKSHKVRRPNQFLSVNKESVLQSEISNKKKGKKSSMDYINDDYDDDDGGMVIYDSDNTPQ